MLYTASYTLDTTHCTLYVVYWAACTIYGVPDVICYDNRQRNIILEQSSGEAIEQLTHFKQIISTNMIEDRHFTLQAMLCNEKPATSIPSSLYRECHYVLDHTIHHMAMMKIIATLVGVSLPETFGVAYATQSYRQSVVQ